MWARARLDIGYGDIVAGLVACAVPAGREALTEKLERLWSPRGDAITCYSVRSGFDLALRALEYPAGSEILFSALNIKGMVKVARRLEIVPVPIDVDFDTMRPQVEAIEAAITPRTRALVVAPLFGTRFELQPIIELARRHDLDLIEDCAQAFSGTDYTGHDEATISMFSFGPLKFATALGGALMRVRRPELLARMREVQADYPVAGRLDFAGRLLKFAALKMITTRPIFALIARFFRARGQDYEDTVTDAVRGVAKLGSADRIRKRCATPLLKLMHRRIRRFRDNQLDPRRTLGRSFQDLLPAHVTCPGAGNAYHNFWAFPVVVDDPDRCMAALRQEGFDAAMLRRSQAIDPPEDRPELTPHVARDTLAHLLVLPCYPGMPKRELERQAEVLKRAVG